MPSYAETTGNTYGTAMLSYADPHTAGNTYGTAMPSYADPHTAGNTYGTAMPSYAETTGNTYGTAMPSYAETTTGNTYGTAMPSYAETKATPETYMTEGGAAMTGPPGMNADGSMTGMPVTTTASTINGFEGTNGGAPPGTA